MRRLVIGRLVLALLLLPAVALAEAAGVPSLGDRLLDLLTNTEVWIAIIGLVYIWKFRGTQREAKVRGAISLAYHATENAKALGLLPKRADKVAHALKELDGVLRNDGLKVTDHVETLARATWSAMHGEQKVAEKLSVPPSPGPAPSQP